MKSCKQATRRKRKATRRRRKATRRKVRKVRKVRKLITRGGQRGHHAFEEAEQQGGGHDFEEAEHYHLNIQKPAGQVREMAYPLYKNEIRSDDNPTILAPAATVGSIREYIKHYYEDIKEPFQIEWLGNKGIPLSDDTLLSSLKLPLSDDSSNNERDLPLYHRGNPDHRTFKIVQ